jgi:hypothetical protein
VRVITAVHREHDHQLKSLYLLKKDDSGVLTIECTINRMADQSFCFVDAIAKNVPVQIDDHFIPTDFLVIDMGEDEYDLMGT